MTLILLLIIICLLGGVGAGPWWGYHEYGYGPSGIFGVVLIVLIVLLLLGHRF